MREGKFVDGLVIVVAWQIAGRRGDGGEPARQGFHSLSVRSSGFVARCGEDARARTDGIHDLTGTTGIVQYMIRGFPADEVVARGQGCFVR